MAEEDIEEPTPQDRVILISHEVDVNRPPRANILKEGVSFPDEPSHFGKFEWVFESLTLTTCRSRQP